LKSGEPQKKESAGDMFSSLELKQTVVGHESQYLNRKTLEILQEPEEKIVTLFKECNFIGKFELFNTTFDMGAEFLEIISSLPSKIIGKAQNALPPDDFLQLYDSLAYIQQLSLTASGICPNPVVNQSLHLLTSCTISGEGTKSSPIAMTGDAGTIIRTYIYSYTSLLKEVLPNTIYSNTLQAFVPKKLKEGQTLKVTPQFFLTRSSLSSLYRIIGIKGMIGLDCAAASLAVDMMDKLSETLSPFLAKADNMKEGKPIFEYNPKMSQEAAIMKQIIHICLVLQFRKLLRMAIPNNQDILDYPYMKRDIAPHHDLVLFGRLANSKIQDTLLNPGWTPVWRSLWGSEAFGDIEYNAEIDAFNDNAHLLPLISDAVYGTLYRRNAKFPLQTAEEELVKWAFYGIDDGIRKYRDNKKISYPDQLICLVLDHLVKCSYYADYSMLEQFVSYQLIRSIYTSTLRKAKSSDSSEKK